jgi:hypothetical protein
MCCPIVVTAAASSAFQGPCSFDRGLASSYPQYKYRVYDPSDDADRSFGLLGDSDHLWTKTEREQQKHQVRGERMLVAGSA